MTDRAKPCFKCGLTKPITEFYRHAQMADGYLNKCKDCQRRDVKINRDANLSRFHAYDIERSKRPERKAKAIDYQRSARAEDPVRYKARNAVSNALRDGRLLREPCKVCGTTEGVEAHHSDYARPLDVEWLCFAHHRHDRHGQQVEAV